MATLKRLLMSLATCPQPLSRGVEENLPNAAISFDKFHVLKGLNAAVDEIQHSANRDIDFFCQGLLCLPAMTDGLYLKSEPGFSQIG
jgi:transposase